MATVAEMIKANAVMAIDQRHDSPSLLEALTS